jgi:hypothetical protein
VRRRLTSAVCARPPPELETADVHKRTSVGGHGHVPPSESSRAATRSRHASFGSTTESSSAEARLDRHGRWMSSGPASSEQEERLDPSYL